MFPNRWNFFVILILVCILLSSRVQINGSGVRNREVNYRNQQSLNDDDLQYTNVFHGSTTSKLKRSLQKSQSRSISKAMCQKYGEYVWRLEKPPILFQGASPIKTDLCGGLETPLITKGSKSKPREFPHMAQIGYRLNRKVGWACGGSLISARFVLSAAHCTELADLKIFAQLVRLGELDTSTENDEAKPQVLEIIERINHPDYNLNSRYNDIALYKLEKDAVFDAFVRPICLQTEFQLKTSTAIAAGWGNTNSTFNESSNPSNHLLKVTLKLASHAVCKDSYSVSPTLQEGIVQTSQLCAGDNFGKDTCQGDSGGPLMIPLRDPYCMYSVIGVTSFGKYCGSTVPAVYTRVSFFVPWIESIVWPSTQH